MSAKLITIVERIMVPHTAFTDALDRLEQYFDYTKYSAEPICFALLGESRTGKTRLLEEFRSLHPPKRTKNGMTVPVLLVRAPPVPTVKGMIDTMLHAYGDRIGGTATLANKTEQVQTLIKACKTRAIIVEEFNHFVDSANGKVRFSATDWLKQIADLKHIMICVSGLESSRAAVSQNEQFAGRFQKPFIMPRFDWQKADDREEFIAILREFESMLRPHFDLPGLSGRDMAFRMYCATGGIIGYISKILREAVMAAMRAKRNIITLADLAKADDAASWSRGDSDFEINAFAPTFKPVPTTELMLRVKQIGTREEAPTKDRARSKASATETQGSGKTKPNVGTVLQARGR